MKPLSHIFVILLGLFIIFIGLKWVLIGSLEVNECDMTYMWPNLFKMEVQSEYSYKYTLHIYREGEKYIKEPDFPPRDKDYGIPILFIPGNAGSYKQVRSLASETTRLVDPLLEPELRSIRKKANTSIKFDFWSVDFNDELSAFSGELMKQQTRYTNQCIKLLLGLYKNSKTPVSKIIIIGHSMGGMVARALYTVDNYVPNSVENIFTFSTPHKPAFMCDLSMENFYDKVDHFWRVENNKLAEKELQNVAVVSLGGSFRDTLIDDPNVRLYDLIPENHYVSVSTDSIPEAWVQSDHQCILWCNQVMKVVSKMLVDLIDERTKQPVLSLQSRIAKFKSHLIENTAYALNLSTKGQKHNNLVVENQAKINSLLPQTFQKENFKQLNKATFSKKQYTKLSEHSGNNKFLYELPKNNNEGIFFSTDITVENSAFYIGTLNKNSEIVSLNELLISLPPEGKMKDDFVAMRAKSHPVKKNYVYVRSVLILTPSMIQNNDYLVLIVDENVCKQDFSIKISHYNPEETNKEVEAPAIFSPQRNMRTGDNTPFLNITLTTDPNRKMERVFGQIFPFTYSLERTNEAKEQNEITSYHLNPSNMYSTFNVNLQKKDQVLYRLQTDNVKKGATLGHLVVFFDYPQDYDVDMFIDAEGILGNFMRVFIPQVLPWCFIAFCLWELLGEKIVLSLKFHVFFVSTCFFLTCFEIDTLTWELLKTLPLINRHHSYYHFVTTPSLFLHSIHLLVSLSIITVFKLLVWILFTLLWLISFFFQKLTSFKSGSLDVEDPLSGNNNSSKKSLNNNNQQKKKSFFDFVSFSNSFYEQTLKSFLLLSIFVTVLSYFVHINILLGVFLIYLSLPESPKYVFEPQKMILFCRCSVTFALNSLDLIVWIRSIAENGYFKRESLSTWILYSTVLFSINNILFYKSLGSFLPSFFSFYKSFFSILFSLLFCMISFGRLKYLILLIEIIYLLFNFLYFFSHSSSAKVKNV